MIAYSIVSGVFLMSSSNSDQDQSNTAAVTAFVPADFSKDLINKIRYFDEAMSDLEDMCDVALESVSPEHSSPFQNKMEEEEFSSEMASLHDEIIALMDHVLVFYCYALKNIEFMPAATRRVHQQVNQELGIAPVIFSDSQYLAGEIKRVIEETFPVLLALRENWTQRTIKRRRQDGWFDEYATYVLENSREITEDDMQSRMEVNFFNQFQFPLGVFEMRPSAHSYLSERMQDMDYILDTLTDLRRGNLSQQFPGFYIQINEDEAEATGHPTFSIIQGGKASDEGDDKKIDDSDSLMPFSDDAEYAIFDALIDKASGQGLDFDAAEQDYIKALSACFQGITKSSVAVPGFPAQGHSETREHDDSTAATQKPHKGKSKAKKKPGGTKRSPKRP
jgi:hypothetical protein